MGIYINPKNCSKEEWLSKHGTPVVSPDFSAARAEGKYPVCLVDNGPFTAAGVCDTQRELDHFASPDGRRKKWFHVGEDDLEAVDAHPTRIPVRGQS